MAKLVGELSIRWTTVGHNVPTVAGAIHAEFGVPLEVDQMMDLVVAWEEINAVRYDPALGKFVKCAVKAETTHQAKSSHESKSVAELERKLVELEDQVQKAKKRAQRSEKGLEYLDRLFTKEIVEKLRDCKEGLAEWMPTSMEMVERSFEETLMDEDPVVGAEAVWELVVRSYAKYERKYHKAKESDSSGKSGKVKYRCSRSRSRGRKRTSSRRRRSKSESDASGRSSDEGSDGEVFYRGKWKFQIVDGVEYVIAKNKRWRTDRAPPGDCDHCGKNDANGRSLGIGEHWFWRRGHRPLWKCIPDTCGTWPRHNTWRLTRECWQSSGGTWQAKRLQTGHLRTCGKSYPRANFVKNSRWWTNSYRGGYGAWFEEKTGWRDGDKVSAGGRSRYWRSCPSWRTWQRRKLLWDYSSWPWHIACECRRRHRSQASTWSRMRPVSSSTTLRRRIGGLNNQGGPMSAESLDSSGYKRRSRDEVHSYRFSVEVPGRWGSVWQDYYGDLSLGTYVGMRGGEQVQPCLYARAGVWQRLWCGIGGGHCAWRASMWRGGMPCPGRGLWYRGQRSYQGCRPDGGMIWNHSEPKSSGRHGSSYGTKMMDGR